MDELLRHKREEICRIAASHGATDIRLFGSQARGEAGTASDLDFLVKLAPGRTLLDLVAIKQDLEDLLCRPVDVVTEESLSPYIRPQVLKELKPIKPEEARGTARVAASRAAVWTSAVIGRRTS
jgi:uncharacterized protein